MKHSLMLLSLVAALASSGPARAVPGGPLGTLPLGYYVCGLPGDVTGPALRHVPSADFTIVSASSYTAMGERGTYLLTGDDMAMTGGPHHGRRFQRDANGLLYLVDADGERTGLTCSLGRPPEPDRGADCPEGDA